MINLDLEKQITAQIEQTIRDYIVSTELYDSIKKQVDTAVTAVIQQVANKVYSDVVNQQSLTKDISSIVKHEAIITTQKQSLESVKLELSQLPVKKIVENLVKQEINLRLDTLDFPDNSINHSSIKWEPGALNGSHICGGRITNFNSLGIDDRATDFQLTITDGLVVIDKELTVETVNVTENLNVNNISILGTLEIGTDILDHGPFSQMIQMHSQMMIDQSLEAYTPLLRDGKALLDQNSLAASITQSNIRKLGNLQDLNVMGDAKFSETLFVSAAGKVGINTDEPRGALTIRDEEAEVSFARTRRHTMFIGSTRLGDIEFGTNNQSQLVLKENQIDINSPIRILGIKFTVANGVPDRDGEQNEIQMVTDARDDQPLFYVCRGGNKWQALGR
jgi:hypothetical protein